MVPIAIAEFASTLFVFIAFIGQIDCKDKSQSHKWLVISLVAVFFYLFADGCAYTLVDASISFPLRYMLNYISYCGGHLIMFFFLQYCKYYIGEKTPVNPWVYYAPELVLVILIIVTSLEFITGKLIVFENEIAFTVNDLPYYLRFFQLCVMIYMPIVALSKRKTIGLKAVLLLGLVSVAPVFASVFALLTSIDFTAILGAMSLILVATMLQKDEARTYLINQGDKLKKALEQAERESKRTDLAIEMFNSSKWSYEISSNDEVLSATYSGKRISKLPFTQYENPMSWIDTIHPDDRESTLAAFMAPIYDHSGKTDYDVTFRTKINADEYCWVKSAGKIIRHADGSGEYIGMVIDITEQMEEQQKRLLAEEERKRAKQTEIELIKSQLRADSLAFIQDNNPDLDRAINYFGNRILEISGCDQMIFRSIDGKRMVVNAPGVEEIPSEICSTCPFSNFDLPQYKDGYIILNDSRAGCNGLKPHHDCSLKSSFMHRVFRNGELAGLLSIHYFKNYHTFTDDIIDIMKTITIYCGLLLGRIESKKTEQEKILAEASNKAKSEFLFNMSHDIRTPMNAIIGFTNKAISHRNEESVLKDSLGKLKKSCDYLLGLVNNILDMARIESGKLEIHEQLIYCDYSRNALLEVFEAEASTKDITFHSHFETQDKYIWVDEVRANQIVANLLSNAIKYTNPGGEIWYTIVQEPSEIEGKGKFIITIRDTGRGMSAKFIEKLFGAFEREETSENHFEQGSGLGMSIVKRLVDIMGGSIDVQSEEGEGTTVTVTCYHRIATDEETSRFRTDRILAAEKQPVRLEGKKILLVDDNQFNREIAVDILELQGGIVDEAYNGQNCVDIIREKGPDYYDVVLMDIQMPVMNGYEATKAIRQLFPDAALPIIALSANTFSEDREESIAAGMNEHVAKPITITELTTVLSRLMH